jgi:hypothetical protein
MGILRLSNLRKDLEQKYWFRASARWFRFPSKSRWTSTDDITLTEIELTIV